MNSIGNFPKNSKNIIVFAYTYVLKSFALYSGYFFKVLYSIDSDEVRR
jgi:hypothetical protein